MEKRRIDIKDEDFQLPDKIRKLIVYIDYYLENFPHKYVQIKDRLANTSYDMLYNAYKANKTDNVYVKMDLIDDLYTNAQIIDFLINLSYEKNIINKKRLNKFGNSLGTIEAMLTGWKKSVMAEKSRFEQTNSKYFQLYCMNYLKDVMPENQELKAEQNETEKKKEKKINQDNIDNKEKIKEINNENKKLEEKYEKMQLNCPKPSF